LLTYYYKRVNKQTEYHYYSEAPFGFKLGEAIGQADDQGTKVIIYRIPEYSDNTWVAVKEDESDTIRLFWTDSVKLLPMDYLQFPREYPDINYQQKHAR